MITVTLERWQRDHRYGGDSLTGYTLIYDDPKTGPHRIATRDTEDEARAFSERHGWTVGETTEDLTARPAGARGGDGEQGG